MRVVMMPMSFAWSKVLHYLKFRFFLQLKRQSGGGSFRKQFKSYENEAPVQKYNTDVDVQLGKRKKGFDQISLLCFLEYRGRSNSMGMFWLIALIYCSFRVLCSFKVLYSQTSIVRGSREYQISKNFPRITEVRVVKRSIKCWHPFTAKVVDIGFGERTTY
jgi:hypothetical protein